MPQWLSPLEKPVNQEHVDSMQAFMGLGPRPFDLSLKAQTNALDLQIVMVNFGTVCESSGVCTSRQDGGRFFIPLPSGRRLGEGTSRVAWQRSPCAALVSQAPYRATRNRDHLSLWIERQPCPVARREKALELVATTRDVGALLRHVRWSSRGFGTSDGANVHIAG
jgi:hypothetical protein